MQRLQRLRPRESAAQQALPDLLGLGERFGLAFRRGQTVLLAAEPNQGKSAVALWLSVNWAQRGLRVLYFSADSDEYTTWRRATATVTGQPQSYVDHLKEYEAGTALASLKGRVAFDFETDPTYQHITEEVIAFYELWGTYPDVIVVDNLMDVIGDNEDEFAALIDHTRALKRLARGANAMVLMLHHCNEKSGDKQSSHPPAQGDITGKVGKKPEVVVTLNIPEPGLMQFAPVKNREGFRDKTGQTFLTLRFDIDRMQISDLSHNKLGGAA